MDTGCQSMDLHQSHKQRWIPDTNQWIYTSLLKQTKISDANKWTYTNLLKQNKTKGWIPDANQLGLYQSPQNQNKQGYQMPIYGLTPISQTQQNMDVRCQSIWTYSNLQKMIIGIQKPTTWSYNCILTYNKQTSTRQWT